MNHMRAIRTKKTAFCLVCGTILVILIVYFKNGITVFENVDQTSSNDKKSVVKRVPSPHIYIFEEHHEVLQVWFQKTNPKLQYGLVHIDSHSDMAPPFIKEIDFTFGERPTNEEEIKSIMQINDNFIMGAISTGLLDKIAFIHPVDKNEVTGKLSINIGKARYKSVWRVCLCTTDIESSKYVCKIVIRDNDYIEIPPSRCRNVGQYKFIETVPEKLSNSFFTEDKRPLILDIDEDYFGVELPATKLFKLGFTARTIDHFDSILNTIFCPERVEGEERLLDEWFTNFISVFAKHCPPDRLECPPFREIYTRHVFYFIRANSNLLCDKKQSPLPYFEKLWNLFKSFTTAQLKEVQQLGVCYSISPQGKAISFSQFGVHLCTGSNLPNNTAVEEYKRTAQQLDNDFIVLEKLLLQLPQPALITLCRSARDGYVPRSQQRDIEERLLKLLSWLYKIDRKKKVHYDRFLAGGKKGWFNRGQQP